MNSPFVLDSPIGYAAQALEEALFLWNIEYASLYTATTFEVTARTIMKMARILSHFFAMLRGSLRYRKPNELAHQNKGLLKN